MRRFLATAAWLAGCSTNNATPHDAQAIFPKVIPAIRGAHGAQIDIVAVTADGSSAVSQDAEGNTRLWPSLDGSGTSPRVEFRLPKQLYDAAAERAIAEERTVSAVAREALEKYLAS